MLTLVHTSLRGLDWPGQCLREVAAPLDFDVVSHKERQTLVAGLVAAMSGRRRGVGIAAPMTGIGLRVIVVSHGERAIAMANPELVETHGEPIVLPEGNLSLPGVSARVSRPEAVTVSWQSMNTGRLQEEVFEGWLARVIQHELELLDGRMFTDLVDRLELHPTDAERAADAAGYVFGEETPAHEPPRAQLNVVSLPPELIDLQASVLRRPAQPVDLEHFDDLRPFLEQMFLRQYDHAGVGLAAPQVGLSLRMAVIDDREGNQIALLNPEILERAGDPDVVAEGCLSIPGYRGEVERPTAVRVRNHRPDGEPYELEAEGYLARVFQHEIDHLDGVLYPDRGGELFPDTPDVRAETTLKQIQRDEAARSARRR